MWGTIKRRSTDILYSKILRKKRNYTCERCLKREEGGMQVSHFYGRKAETVRFDDENCDCFCAGCHKYFTEMPALYAEWKKKKMGEKAYKILMLRAHQMGKRDDKLMGIILKKEAKELKII